MSNPKLNLTRVNESVCIYRYSNGYMVEVGGRDGDNEWITQKLIFNTAKDAYAFACEVHDSLPLDN
jgi:hypothetical protein